MTRLAGLLCLFVVARSASGETLAAQRERLLHRLAEVHGLTPACLARVRAIVFSSPVLGQGNPALVQHPMTREACEARGALRSNPEFERICGGPFLAPLYRRGESAAAARVCIDQLEFPDIPCEYPVVFVKAREAALLCAAAGKRLCDAHEWEGACAGSLEAPDYPFALRTRGAMRTAHNRVREVVWSYGPIHRKGICATASAKTPGCQGGGYDRCGSNTYPAGSFPACKSAFDVYDLHGNAAEHMNLPLSPGQMTAAGGAGVTEMKGSWFVFDRFYAHPADCRWRAPDWHGGAVMSAGSHLNYHLGFRCCKSLPPAPSPPGSAQQRKPVE